MMRHRAEKSEADTSLRVSVGSSPKRLVKENINDHEYLCFVRLIVAESGKRPDLAQLFLKKLCQPAVIILTEYLQEHPELNIIDCDATARIFVGSLIHFMMVQEVLSRKEVMPIEEDRIINGLIRLIINQKSHKL